MIELIGNEIWMNGYLVARLVDGPPPSIRNDFENWLLVCAEPEMEEDSW